MSKGLIYFITDGEAIKIGWTTNLMNRLRQIQISHHFPLVVLGTYQATRDEEGRLHKRFARHREMGEWFNVCDDIHDFIEDMKEDGVWIEYPEDGGPHGSMTFLSDFIVRKQNERATDQTVDTMTDG